MRCQQGFTLVEMITVIVIASILAAVTSKVITLPARGYSDSQTRATLSDTAEAVFWRMQRDIRNALPNSVRITNSGHTLELLHVSAGGRYRAETNAGSGNVLNFAAADTSFDIMGTLSSVPSGYLVIYNLGDVTSNAYAGTNITPISNTSTTTSMVFTAKQFPLSSPSQRFFVVDTPISYVCNTSTQQLTRYSGYTITAAQASTPSGASSVAMQVNNVSACSFTYSTATSTRNGLVELQFTLSDASGQNTSTLVHQVHVDNMP
jgi:MSHA biogenesis protein MshO